MKIVKNKLLQPSYDVESAGEKELSEYIRKVSYWIGNFVIEFNNLDDAVANLLGLHINGSDVRGYEYIFLSGMTFNQKVELLERLFKYGSNFVPPHSPASSSAEKKIKIISELKDIAKIRNTVAHSNYYSLDKNGNVKEKTRFSESDAEEHWIAITRDFLVENINYIIDLTQEIEDIDEVIF